MFRVSRAPIIRSTQTVVTTTGTSQQLPHFGHVQSEVAARPWALFKRILSIHLQINDLYQWL